MARILYGVCGIGMGHCTRSLEILEELTREHEIIVVSYGSAYRMLKGMFPKTRKVKYFEMLFNETRVSKRKTLLHNLPRLPEILISNLSEYSKMLRDFRPDIVVSDFEIGSFYLSKMLMVPSIVISNMHAMQHIRIKGEKRDANYHLAEKPQLDMFRGADHYIIVSLMKPEKEKEKVHFYYPLVDAELLGKKAHDKGFVLVYCSAASKLRSVLEPHLRGIRDVKFRVYCDIECAERSGNVEIRPFDRARFLQDLADCSAVIGSGGFTLISEAAVMGKPLLAITPRDFYERYYNGLMLRELGIGEVAEQPSRELIEDFLADREKYAKKLARAGIRAGNKEIILKIKGIIKEECRG